MSNTLIRLEQQLLKGAQPSVPGKKALAIKYALNVLGHELSIQPFPGVRRLLNSSVNVPITGLVSLLVAGVPTLFFGTADKLYKFTRAGGISEIGTGYNGTLYTMWSMVRWGQWMLATNGIDAAQVDKSDTFDAVALGGTPPDDIIAFIPWKSLMIAFTRTEIYWSDEDDPETWTPVLSNFAGSLFARDVLSNLTAAIPLGDLVVYFTLDEMRAVAYVGPTNIFGQANIMKGIGTVGLHAVCEANKLLYGWGPKGRWVTDGSSMRIIDNPEIKDFIESDFNRDAQAGFVTWHHAELESVVFSYTTKNSVHNDVSVAYQYTTDSWWPLGFGRTAVNAESAFGYPIAADSNGDIWEMPVEHDLAGNISGVGIPLNLSEGGHLIYQLTESAFGETLFGTAPHGEMRTF